MKVGARLRLVPRDRERDEGSAGVDADLRKGVQSVDIAFSILRVLDRADRPLSLGEIAQRAAQQPSKVHHYLVSLMRNDVVTQLPTGRYDLGAYALELGLAALRRLDVVERSVEAVAAFRDATGEAAFLAVWGSHGPTIVRYMEGVSAVVVEARAGLVLPVLTSATGHVFLTWLAEPSWQRLAEKEQRAATEAGEPPLDPTTVRAATLARGIAVVDGDLLPRIAALSVPVFTHEGHLACALTTLGWRGELDVDAGGATAASLHEAGRRLSRQLGFASGYPELRPAAQP